MQGTSIVVPVRTMGETIRTSLAGAINTFVSALPRLLGCVAVLIIGWVLSSLLARGVAAMLHAAALDGDHLSWAERQLRLQRLDDLLGERVEFDAASLQRAFEFDFCFT